MNLKATLALMVLFIVLGSFAIFDPLRRAEKEEALKERESHVLWLKDRKLEAIRVSGGRHPAVSLECNTQGGCAFDGTGDWKVTEPQADKADNSAAASLASTILNLTHHEKIDLDAPPEPAEFGFEHPQAELSLRIAGEKEPLTLKFGAASAIGENVYLSASTEPKRVFLVPSYLVGMVSKEPYHWRNKRLFPGAEATNLTRLGWKAGKLEVRAYRMKDVWMLEKPVNAPAGQVMLGALASSIAYASAKALSPLTRASAAGKKILAGKPELEVVFTLLSGEGHEVSFYAKDPSAKGPPKTYLAAVGGSNALYEVDPVQLERFRREFLEYRERNLINEQERADVASVRFTFPKERVETVFKLGSGGWEYESGEKLSAPVSQERVNGFLNGLREASFTGFFPAKGSDPEAKAFRSSGPALYFEIKDKDGKLIEKANVGVFRGTSALIEKDGELRALGPSFLRLLPARQAELSQAPEKLPEAEKKGGDDGHGHHHHGH